MERGLVGLALRQGSADTSPINLKWHQRHLIGLNLFELKIKTKNPFVERHGALHVVYRNLKIHRRIGFLCHFVTLM